MNHIRKNDYNYVKLHAALILSGVAALFSIATFFFGGASQQSIIHAIYKVEALKAGGEKNWEKLQKLYSNPTFQQKQGESIDAALSQLGAGTANNDENNTNNNQQNPSNNTLTSEQVSTILANAAVDGNKNSDIILIEYSDFECPFCQKHFENWTVESLLKTKNIAHVFKQFPLSFHPLAQKAAEGGLCVKESLWSDKFYDYVKQTFASKNPTVETITTIAAKLGMKETEFKKCLDSNSTATQVSKEEQEGQSVFWVNGTPGNVLLNKKTGKFVVVSGAQPVSAFEQALTQIQ